jgi:transposase
VEQFEQIRRDRDREGLSIRALAERHGVHRRAVRQALASPLPPAKRAPVSRPAPKLGPFRAVVDEWLEADRDAPRKQRHTARRIWRRLVDEHGADVAEVTVRQYVRRRKRELGWPAGEVFVPQVHAPGREAEVDWGQALVELAGVPTTAHLFVMRASFSGAAFCQASLVATPAGVPRAARAGVRVVRRRVRGDPLRQPGLRGQEGAQGPPARRVRSVCRAAVALLIRVAVHDAGP